MSDPSPFPLPGPRWTGDPGAVPGEPAYELDGGRAALIEIQTAKGSRWRVVLEGGGRIGESISFTEAARMAERVVPVRTGPTTLSLTSQYAQPL